jgi:hypothetical protein
LDTNIKARKGLLGFFFFPEFELSPILWTVFLLWSNTCQ